MVDPAADALISIDARQPEAHHLACRRVAAESQDGADALTDARVGGGKERGSRADAHTDHQGRRRAPGERGDHRLDVLPPEPSAREPGDRRHRHVEPGPRQQRRGFLDSRVVLAFWGEAVDQHQWGAGVEPGVDVEIGAGARDEERPTGRRRGQHRERGWSSLDEELQEKRPGQQRGPCGPRDGDDEGQSENERGEPDYFRLTHFTRRHPSNMLTWVIDSGTRPTCSRSGARGRFDFQPRRVQTGASRSSTHPVSRRSLLKWFRSTMIPPGFTTRRISLRTATGSGTAEIV